MTESLTHPSPTELSLRDLGLHRATDVIGGFRAWCEAGLPSVPAPGPGLSSVHAG